MMRYSITSIPLIFFGRSFSVTGSVCSSFRHGIWMMSFISRTPFPEKLDIRNNREQDRGHEYDHIDIQSGQQNLTKFVPSQRKRIGHADFHCTKSAYTVDGEHPGKVR